MGERAEGTLFRPDFNRSVRVEASRSSVTDDAGALLLRELAERLGLPAALGQLLDHRNAERVTHPLVELVMTRVLLLALGWHDQDDADTLRDDPAFRLAVSTRRGPAPLETPEEARTPDGLASQPTLSRMQGMLASALNRWRAKKILAEQACARILATEGRRAEVTFDIDSYALEAHGAQQGVAYNGHYHMECFHPLVAYADTGDMLGVRLRSGNVHTADDVRSLITELLPHVRTLGQRVWLRMDCGYANGKLMAWIAERGVTFITRLRTNPVLTRTTKGWCDRTVALWKKTPSPDGRLRQGTQEFWYRPKSWTRVVRVVAVLVERNQAHGELFHHTFFLATNAARNQGTSNALLARYRERGNAEQRIGEFLTDIAATVSSTPRPRADSVPHKRAVGIAENEVSLILGALAFNLLHALRIQLAPVTEQAMSFRRLRERLLKTAATVTRHARQVTVRINPAKAALWSKVQAYLPTRVAAAEGTLA